jgi:hypothetical protein
MYTISSLSNFTAVSNCIVDLLLLIHPSNMLKKFIMFEANSRAYFQQKKS